MIDKQLLLQGCKQFEIELSTQAAEQLDTYAQLLVEWNGKMNLTAITDPQGIVFKHFVDSLLLLKAVELPQGSSLIDVGAGAGFPSMPVKIARPDLAVTMLDSLQKRLTFLEEVSRQLELDCTFIHARAEDGGREKKLRERFDFATARAVAHLRELAEYCLPYVKVGGYFVALKGSRRTGGDCGKQKRHCDDGRKGGEGDAVLSAGKQHQNNRCHQENIANSDILPQDRCQNGKKTDFINRIKSRRVER